jgi:CBS domain-containing protein/mannitol/fructose-specific phosphotransferase system IIA component (Ntr-type)
LAPASEPLRLGRFLAPALTVVPLHATEVVEAAAALAERLGSAGLVSDTGRLVGRIAEDRSEDTVALGDRAFVLHYRTDAARQVGVAIGTSPRPIRRELRDGEAQRARVVVLVVAPPRLAASYLQIVSGLARTLSRQEVVEAMLRQPDAEALAALPELAAVELPSQLTVRDLMTERPRVTRSDTLLREAAVDMVNAGLGALPVVDEDSRLVGLLGERDLLRDLLTSVVLGSPVAKAPTPGADRRRRVRDVMTRQVLCVAPEQPLSEVVSLMVNKNVDRLPVVRQGQLVGFLTRGDILRQLIGP